MEAETDRLAEAYAAGARVLGQQLLEPSLHAADYVATDRREEPTEVPLDMLPQLAGDEPAPREEEQTREELRASALRAKLKAQATHQEPPTTGDAGLDQPDTESAALGHGRARTWTSARVGTHRSSLLLGGAMAVLFGTGFMAVNSFLAAAPPTGATATQQRTLEAQPADADKSDLAPSPDGWKAAPVPQPALRRPTPDAATDDSAQPQPAPTRRLYRLQSGTAALPPIGATPVMLSSQNAAGASSADTGATMADAEAEIPSTVATPKMRQAAAAGDAFAQFEIATRFAEGKGVAQDHGQAFAWYERAATRGLAAAQFRLAAYYERGLGVEPDKERAKVWYIRAADQGYVRAMHNLGVLTVGTGERQADYLAASRWFRQAADRGLADSQFNLAILYENGRGVQKSLPEAYKWFALAARSGDAVAARRLEQVRTRLTAAELDAAEEKIATWSPVASAPITGSISAIPRR
jgi:localization factor PodJL